MEFNKKVQIALGKMFKDVELNKVATPKKVELGLVDDIDAKLDKAIKGIRQAEAMLKKANDNLLENDITLNEALKLVIDAEQKAKELGAKDLIKLFSNRKDEVKNYQKAIDGAYNKIQQGISEL